MQLAIDQGPEVAPHPPRDEREREKPRADWRRKSEESIGPEEEDEVERVDADEEKKNHTSKK